MPRSILVLLIQFMLLIIALILDAELSLFGFSNSAMVNIISVRSLFFIHSHKQRLVARSVSVRCYLYS